jgi:hypothetical protein
MLCSIETKLTQQLGNVLPYQHAELLATAERLRRAQEILERL